MHVWYVVWCVCLYDVLLYLKALKEYVVGWSEQPTARGIPCTCVEHLLCVEDILGIEDAAGFRVESPHL